MQCRSVVMQIRMLRHVQQLVQWYGAGKIKLCIVALIHWHTFDSDACTCTGDWPSNDACINQLQTGYYYCIGNEPALCFDLFEALSTT